MMRILRSRRSSSQKNDEDFKKQAIKLAKEVGNTAAAEELGIPKGTLGTWMHKARLRVGSAFTAVLWR